MKFRILLMIFVVLTSACSEGGQNNKSGILTKDYKEISDFKTKDDLEKTARANDPEALFVLGSMYATG